MTAIEKAEYYSATLKRRFGVGVPESLGLAEVLDKLIVNLAKSEASAKMWFDHALKQAVEINALKKQNPVGHLDGLDECADFMSIELRQSHELRSSTTPKRFTIPVYLAAGAQPAHDEFISNLLTKWKTGLVCGQDAMVLMFRHYSSNPSPKQDECWCDAMGIGKPGVSCGDCPTRDYAAPVQAQPAKLPAEPENSPDIAPGLKT
jgi:hypothetical protein